MSRRSTSVDTCSRGQCVHQPVANESARGERGVVLVVSLMVVAFLSALLLCVVTVVSLNLREAFVLREGQRARDAARSALHLACDGLGRASSWSAVLAGIERSPFLSADRVMLASDRSVQIDLADRGARLQRRSEAEGAFGPNQPLWQRYLSGHLSTVTSLPLGRGDVLLAAWVADDPGDADGDARADTNGVVLIHVEAFGPSGVRASLRAAVERRPGWAVVRTRWVSVAH